MSHTKKTTRVIQYELQHLIERRITVLLLAGYALIALVISIFDSFREVYFSAFDSAVLELANFVLPVFLFVNLVLVLSPMFAGEIENHIEEIPSTCVYGCRTRCICKLLATLLFVILLNVAYHLITCMIGLLTQPLETWSQLVTNVGGKNLFDFHWSAWSHYLFASLSLILGSIVTAVFTLLISCNRKATMTVCAEMSFIGILEFMLNRFSFWDILQQFNLWQLLTPYRLASDGPFYYPAANVAAVGGFFTVICTAMVWRIVTKGV